MLFNFPAELFFSTGNIEKVLIKNKNINQFIFLFKNRDYGDIVANLALFNIIISGGSNTKNHILSPIQLRLARFLIAILPLTGSDVANSFHSDRRNKNAGFDFTTKEAKEEIAQFLEYKVKEDDSKESSFVNSKGDSIKKFHTISCLQNNHNLVDKASPNLIEVAPVPVKPIANTISGDKGEMESSTILSYLDSIQSIINNPDNTPEKAQSLIENTWISILMEQLNDEKKLFNKYSHRFSKFLLEANKTLISLQENNVIKKKFPLLYKELDSIDFIFITYSLCFSYFNRLNYTALTEVVGNNILYRIFKKSEFSTYPEFNNQMKVSKFTAFKVGDFFITLLSQFPHDLFERNISPSSYYTKETATLGINSEYLEDVKNNIILHPYTLPMICKPNIWTDSSYGGFLDNEDKEVSVITGSHRHNHLVENKKALFKSINYLNSIKFSINNLLLEYLNKEGNYLLNSSKEKDFQRAITLKIASTFSNIPFYLNVHAD
jgi:hypothetical protein